MITWTNNSTDDDNRWSVGETAEWYATGELPDWVTGDLSGVKPVFVFSQEPELTARGDTLTGSGTVSYNSTTNTLTISEPIGIDLNNWTVEINQPDGTGVLRWPGWGAVSARWADPGCHAWDANVGDLTHEITRTIELSGEDGWSTVDAIDVGTYRLTYDMTGAASVSREVTLPTVSLSEHYPPMVPGMDPPVGVRPPVLNRVEMTGEGGYLPMAYMYQNIDTVYMVKSSTDLLTAGSDSGYLSIQFKEDQLWMTKANNAKVGGLGMLPDDRMGSDLTLTRDDGHTVTFATIPNVIRVATGNYNSCTMFRDGAVFAGSGTMYGYNVPGSSFQYNWLSDNWEDIVDMFMPTSYVENKLPNVAIMKDGSLVGLDLQNPTLMADPPTILTDLKRIRAINQGHTGDMVCETNDGSLYWIHGYGYNDTYEWSAEKMDLGVTGDEIHLMSIGDYAAGCRVVLHDEPRKTRQIHSNRVINETPTIPDGLYTQETFDSDLLDITANEPGFSYALEDKLVYDLYAGNSVTTDTSTFGEYVRAIGSTAYAVIHKYTTGYYVGVYAYGFKHAKNMTALEKYIIDNA